MLRREEAAGKWSDPEDQVTVIVGEMDAILQAYKQAEKTK